MNRISLLLLFVIIYSFLPKAAAQVDYSKVKITYQCPPCGCPKDGHHFEKMGVCPDCNMGLRAAFTGIELKRSPSSPRKTVGILLFDGADIMDVTGPWSVFEHAGMNVVTVAKELEVIELGMTMHVQPDFTLQTLPNVDVLVVPGGGPAEMDQDMEIVNWIKGRFDETETVFSVCSGAFFLGLAGLLDGREATTFASLIPTLKNQFPHAKVLNDVKYTDSDKVVTSAGLSSGIDAAFHVVSKYYGQGRAQDVANHMEYAWNPESDYARTHLADNYINGIRTLLRLFSSKYISSGGDKEKWEYRFLLTEQLPASQIMLLLDSELSKMDRWKVKSSSNTAIKGIIEHSELGKAKVEIRFEKEPKGTVATVVAVVL